MSTGVDIQTTIRDSLGYLHEPGTVYEIRALQVGKVPTHSGYFNDHGKAAEWCLRADREGAAGVYVTLNPCNPELLARANNRLKAWAKTTTTDKEIVSRRWLFLDFDAIRPSGIAATDIEKAAATDLAIEVEGLLRGRGWPMPMVCDSGNGRYLDYRIDLPNDDESTDLIKRFYKGLNALLGVETTSGGKVDTSVFNAARIARVGGTSNRKGDPVPERPHRMCIYHPPRAPLEVVEVSLIRAIADLAVEEKPKRPSSGKKRNGDKLDIVNYLAEKGIEYRTKPVADGTAYLITCPFDTNHGRNGESAVYQATSGLLTYKCMHDSCQGRTWADVRSALGDPPKDEPKRIPRTGNRPYVELLTDEHISIRETIDALASDKQVYQRGGQLVDIVSDSLPKRRGITSPDVPRIVEIPEPRLRTRLSACARYFVIVESKEEVKEVLQHPPHWLVKGVSAAGSWPNIRRLEAVVTAPVLRHDGTVLQTPGYDAESGILYTPTRVYPEVPRIPLADEVSAAIEALEEVIVDFPFERPEHRSGWFAATFTPIARFAFDGPAPLFLVDANIRGAGKGLAVDAAGIVATGEGLATANYSHDDSEMRKAITSIAIAGDRAVLLDNIGGSFGVPSLDAALTSTKWKDRVLGGNTTFEGPLYVTWYATGNNVVLTGDIVRRICHIRLNSPEETPEEREGFRHADLRAWLHQEQPRLLSAALTILRAYVVAGGPDQRLKPWGSFEGWSALVRNAIVWAGLPDPGAIRQELAKQSDTEGAQLRALLAGWLEVDEAGRGMTIAEVFELLGNTGSEYFSGMRAALNDWCLSRKGDRPTPDVLRYKLRRFRKRVVGGLFFDTDGDHRGAAIWKVKRL